MGEMEVGCGYRFVHRRRGEFEGVVERVDGEWVHVRLAKGCTVQGASAAGVVYPGEVLVVRRSLLVSVAPLVL